MKKIKYWNSEKIKYIILESINSKISIDVLYKKNWWFWELEFTPNIIFK